MSDFMLKILTPDKKFLTESVEEIVFDTPDGRVGVMAGHMLMVFAVAEGTVDIKIGDEWKLAAVGHGFAEIGGDMVEVFVDTAEWAEEIDAARARVALERAQLSLKSSQNRIEYLQNQAAMARALARLKAASGSFNH